MPLIANTSHLRHEAVTKHTWSPNQDTVRYQAAGSATYKDDMFAHGDTADTPHISEYTMSHKDPQEWAERTRSMTLVHTGGGTNMAEYTHHTVSRPKFPPGSINTGAFTLSQYLPAEDKAVEELHIVCEKVMPMLPKLLEALDGYHLHSPDGWIQTAGFMTCCRKVGLELLRSEFLALERSVPKDTAGRINYHNVASIVEAVTCANAADDLTATAPEALLKATA